MTSRSFIALILLLVASPIYAQVPGYLGKKTLIGINGTYSPAYGSLFTEYKNDLQVSDVLLPFPKIGITAKFVIHDHKTFNLGLAYQRSVPISDYEYDGNIHYQNVVSSAITLTAGVTQHHFHVAPVGSYSAFNGCLIIINNHAYGSPVYKTPDKQYEQVIDFGINSEFGTRRVIADKLVLDMGIEVNFYVLGFISVFQSLGTENIADNIKHVSRGTNYLNNIGCIKLGVHYLL